MSHVSLWILNSELENQLFGSLDTISLEAFYVSRFLVLMFYRHGDAKFVGRPLKVSLRGHIFNYWRTNNIRFQTLSSLQTETKYK